MEAEYFLELIRQFLNRELPARTFCDQFIALWVRHRDATSARAQDWPEPYDQRLIAAWKHGELTGDAFHREWVKLWGYDEKLHGMIDPLHSACSVFRRVPEEYWEINEEQLRSEVESAVAAYRSCACSE